MSIMFFPKSNIVLTGLIRQRIILRSHLSTLSASTTAFNRVPVNGSHYLKSRETCNKQFTSFRFASTGIIPESIVTFNPNKVETQKPAIEPLDTEKGDIVDLSNFLLQPEATPEQLETIAHSLKAVTVNDLDIIWWLPTGGVYKLVTSIHDYGSVPWFGAIAIMTLLFRLVLTPVVARTRKYQALQSRYTPMMIDAQERFDEAKVRGDKYELAVAGQDLNSVRKKMNPNMFKTIAMPMIQLPFFASTFMVLRKMANYPVESLKEGGIFWFTDLTVADPYYILPVVTAVTMHFVLRKGLDTGADLDMMNPKMKNGLLYGIPVVIVGLTYSFPAALLCYWTTTNFISLAQAWLFNVQAVKDYFGIPEKKVWKPEDLRRRKNKESSEGGIAGMWAGAKEKYASMAEAKKVEDYRRLQASVFKSAGNAPIRQTFKHNPKKEIK